LNVIRRGNEEEEGHLPMILFSGNTGNTLREASDIELLIGGEGTMNAFRLPVNETPLFTFPSRPAITK